MNTGKDIIFKYCKKQSQLDVEHIDNCKYNLRCFELNNLTDLCGCPNNYGLEKFIGDCETVDQNKTFTIKELKEQCNNCWDRALALVVS